MSYRTTTGISVANRVMSFDEKNAELFGRGLRKTVSEYRLHVRTGLHNFIVVLRSRSRRRKHECLRGTTDGRGTNGDRSLSIGNDYLRTCFLNRKTSHAVSSQKRFLEKQ